MKSTVDEHFPDALAEFEACISVAAQLKINNISNCLALYLVGQPASLKSTVLSFFYGIESISHVSDNFSPQSFVSHMAGRSEADLQKTDLLPRLKGRILVTPELAPILSADRDELMKRLGIITRVLDGQGYTSDSGVHGKRGYTGDYIFGWLGATTPIPKRVWNVMAGLGPRLYFIKMKDVETTEEELSEMLAAPITYNEKVEACRHATAKFLYALWREYKEGVDWTQAEDPEDIRLAVARYAKLLARLRGNVGVWYNKDRANEEDSWGWDTPIVEISAKRSAQCLYTLARGHALGWRGATQISKEDLGVVSKVALSSAPDDRVKAIEWLIKNDGSLARGEMVDSYGISDYGAKRTLQTLNILGIIDLDREAENQPYVGTLKPEFEWLLKDRQANLDNFRYSRIRIRDVFGRD